MTLEGQMARLAVFDRALTDDEMRTLHEALPISVLNQSHPGEGARR